MTNIHGSALDCFFDSDGESVLIRVTANVGTIECEPCRDRLDLVLSIDGFAGLPPAQRFPLGFGGGGSYTGFFTITGKPCAVIQAHAVVEVFGFVTGCDPAPCRADSSLTLPPVCGDGDCTTGVPGGSEPSSSPTTGLPGGSDGGSAKEAVTPLSTSPTGYAAWSCTESPETAFTDTIWAGVVIRGRVTIVPIEPGYLEGCEPGSIVVQSVVPDCAARVGAVRRGNDLVLVSSWLPWCRPRTAVVTLAGIRLGFAGQRHVPRSREQYLRSNHFWGELTKD
jgi:hypothetical protein